MENLTPLSVGAHIPPLPASKDRNLLNEYLRTLELSPGNTPRLFAIGFLGLPGSGKSTLADRLGERLGLPVNRNDQIRRFLNAKGFAGRSPRQDILPAMAEERTLYFYAHHTSAIIDANFTEFAALSLANAAAYGASLLLLRISCPDEVALERLGARSQGSSAGQSAATAADYARIKSQVATYAPVEEVYLDFDATLPLEPQVQQICTKLLSDGYVVDTLNR